MTSKHLPSNGRPLLRATYVAAALALAAGSASAQSFIPGDLIVSGSTYQNVGSVAALTVGQALPGGGNAVSTGTYPTVFNNATPDSSFGVTSSIFLQDVSGSTVTNTVNFDPTQIMGSFSSKSELSINVSDDGHSLTFMGYAGSANGGNALGSLDISNSNTSAVVDASNPVTAVNPRAIGNYNLSTGTLSVTTVNSYSGNNGRSAVLVNGNYYTVGNAGNSGKTVTNTTLNALSANTGVQVIAQGSSGNTSVIGALSPTAIVNGKQVGGQHGFDVAQAGYAQDKTGKDNNFRGITVSNNTLFVTKGSGGNGINTVYQVGATGALANGGTIPANAAITILPGLSTTLASASAGVKHPFGIWFANPNTLFVADEGDAVAADATKSLTDATLPGGGLSLYTKNAAGNWVDTADFQTGLKLGQMYTVTDKTSGATYSTATDGLRNITGRVNADGTYTIYATTSTEGGNVNGSAVTDVGADPNKVVEITVDPNNTGAAAFSDVETAAYGQVLRGVALAPVPEPATYALFLLGLAGVSIVIGRRTRQ